MPDRSMPMARISLGLMAGGLFGVGGFLLIPLVDDGIDPLLPWGVLLLYPTIGAIIAGVGSALRRRFPALGWPLLGLALGAWLMLVIVFFAHEQMRQFLASMFEPGSVFTSPFWFMVEGAVAGVLIGLAIDRFAGEGRTSGGD